MEFSIYDFGKSEIELKQDFENNSEKEIFSHKIIKRGIAKGLELAALDVLKKAGVVSMSYDKVLDGTISYEKNGIKISGFIDAITIRNSEFNIDAEIPVCIRSIFAGVEQQNVFIKYFGQLAMMMDFKEKENGILIIASDQDIKMFLCKKENDEFYCNNEIINLQNQYERFAKISKEK